MTLVTQATILVIEDDSAIRAGLVDTLHLEDFAVVEAADGHEGLSRALTAECDLILLDLVLPGPQGLDILKEVRHQRPTLPVIIMTALGDEADRIRGLKLGADDYVVKPFSPAELAARVEAVLRRSPERPVIHTHIDLPNGRIDLVTREIISGETRASLSERETELISYLSSHPERPISREEILRRVWKLEPRGLATRTIDMHIARLREKLEDADGELIQTVRGQGYRFRTPPS